VRFNLMWAGSSGTRQNLDLVVGSQDVRNH
jgi:hypothetical protein